MDTITSEQALNILKILDGGAILSKSGSITLCYYLDNPVCYSLSEKDFDKRNNDFFKAFKHLGNNTYVHKQDVYLRKGFNGKLIAGKSFIQRSERLFFDKKMYMDHFCILSFSLSGLNSLNSSYIANPIKYDEHLTEQDQIRLSEFLEGVENAVAIINNIPGTRLTQLSEVDVKLYLFDFVNGFHSDDGIRDNVFDTSISIGDKQGAFFAVCEAEYLPDTVRTCVKDETLSEANASLQTSMLEQLGVHLKATHIVNQMWQFSNEYKSEFKHKVKLFGQHREFDKEIAREAELLSELETDISENHNIICRTHFNVYILEEKEYFSKAYEYVKNVFTINDFRYYLPSLEGLQQIYLGSIIGNVNKLNHLYWYMTDLQSSLCLMLNYTTFKHDNNGIYFTDRLYNTPLKVDIWDKPRGLKLPARNAIVMASTGGGKSVFANNIVQQYIEEGISQVVVEFGKSFYQLTQLYPDVSLHIEYDGETPLGINPFKISAPPSKEKINTLVNLVLKFWRQESIMNDTNQVVAIRSLLIRYYQENPNADHSFEDFYFYIKDNFNSISAKMELNKEYFDYTSFIHVCKEFITGGYYENVCKESELGADIAQKDFIVFELTKIKKDPFLVGVIMSILVDVIETKLLDKRKRGLLLFDEYAETQTMKDTFSDNDIHSTVAFCYQKLRKENSAVLTILQSPSQLADNQYSKGIIANTQVLAVLPTVETVYNAVIDMFSITTESHIDLMQSIRNNFESKEPYSEVFMRFMDLSAIVVRLRLSPEKFMSFQTDGETWQKLQNKASLLGSLEQAIIETTQNK